jgi:hypothetical protein
MYYSSGPLNSQKPEVNQMFSQFNQHLGPQSNNYMNLGGYPAGFQGGYALNGELLKTPLMLYGQLPSRPQYSSQRMSGMLTQKKKPYKKSAA